MSDSEPAFVCHHLRRFVMATERNSPRLYPGPPVVHRQAVARPIVAAGIMAAGVSPCLSGTVRRNRRQRQIVFL